MQHISNCSSKLQNCSNVSYHLLSCILFLLRITQAFSMEYITRKKPARISIKCNTTVALITSLFTELFSQDSVASLKVMKALECKLSVLMLV